MIQYRSAVFADSTKAAYRTHCKNYFTFCELMQVAPAPISSNILCLYVAYLARSPKASSVPLYLNFVLLFHKELGLPSPITGNWLISSKLTGLRRLQGTPPVSKLPITTTMLVSIRARLNLTLSWAIYITSFFGLFRKSRVLPV